MPERILINIEHGVSLFPFKDATKLKFPEYDFGGIWEGYDQVASSPLLKYGQSEGFIQAMPMLEDHHELKSPFKSVRLVRHLDPNGNWVVEEAPVIFLARFHIGSVKDYRDLLNFRAKTTLRGKPYYLELIESFDAETEEENGQEAMKYSEIFSFGLLNEADSNKEFVLLEKKTVIPGRLNVLRRLRFEFVKKRT